MSYFETQELACTILGLDYDTLVNEDREDEIEDGMYDRFEISMEKFHELVKELLPFTPIVKAGISGTLYHAFINEKEGIMIVKQEAKEKE